MDTMNYRWFGYEVDKLPEIYEAIAPWVKHTHMKDGHNARPDYKGAALGDGEIPLDAAVSALKKAGYDGAYCAEYEGSEDGAIGYSQVPRVDEGERLRTAKRSAAWDGRPARAPSPSLRRP
jgi:sugar phosphate isomerase/epimerase